MWRLLLLLLLAGPALADGPRILVMGDSFLAAHRNTGRSVGDILGAELGARVTNRATVSARMIYRLPITGRMGLNIPRQARGGPYDWVVLNGGGNDFLLGCACAACDARMAALISPDGVRGVVPDLVARLRDAGARVVIPGYLRSPGRGSPIEHCADEGAEYEARLARMAAARPGVTFLSNADLVPSGSRAYHDWDMIHPSARGARAVAERLVRHIRGAGG
ncbi:SGNH/GDSL hydrolase family protein [uncultured Jannaschia sp.]|uniref:SGNH/GDSL hydrolase family protein n=1 Tax=uncultured Jannaschia sp. TaxID=293347 RepID=UPI0026380B79|nr:SGNH/GDSL hydrolase family protein [uncultured Jannaschia sp.]